jgi:hypothetical protein
MSQIAYSHTDGEPAGQPSEGAPEGDTHAPQDTPPATATDAVAGASGAQQLPALLTKEVSGPRTTGPAILPAGWALITPAAVKVLLTLTFLGERGKATQKQLADITGLSERTILTALKLLDAHGLLVYEGARGEGTVWRLTKIPDTLPDAAKEYHGAQGKEAAKNLSRRKDELKERGQALKDAASGADQQRFRAVQALIAAESANAEPDGTTP